ncbi:MAG: hypothetical protein JWN15_4076 [Firmicutes bacterium]|nr:hypothetical protein [Bacillota bacterium]
MSNGKKRQTHRLTPVGAYAKNTGPLKGWCAAQASNQQKRRMRNEEESPVSQKVGRIALALALIVLGVVWIIDTWQNTQITRFVAHLWPALLIVLGVEWVAAAARGAHPHIDGGAVALLAVVALFAANFGGSWPWSFGPGIQHAVAFPVPDPPSPPAASGLSAMPALATAPHLFGDVSREVVLTYDGDAAGMQELRVNGEGNGDIRVEQGDKFHVELRVTGYGRDENAAIANADLVRLSVQQGPTTEVRAERPSLQKLGLAFVVTVPPAVKVTLETASGSIIVSGRQGDVTAQSSSGSIRIDEVKGAVRVSSASGSVLLQQVAGKVSAESVSGSVSVTTDQVGGDYALTTTSGSVSLVIPATASVSVNARTTSGAVSGPSWLGTGAGRGSMSGSQGDGAHKVVLRTISGSVRLAVR